MAGDVEHGQVEKTPTTVGFVSRSSTFFRKHPSLFFSLKRPGMWEPPRPLQTWGQKSEHRHESWMELFFDLIFVAAAIQVGGVLKCSLNVPGLLQVYYLFSALNHNWTSFLFYVNKFEKLNVTYLVMYFVLCLLIVMKCGFIAPLAGPECHKPTSDWAILVDPSSVILFHALTQIVFFLLYVQVAVFNEDVRTHACFAALSFFIEGVAWAISSLVVNTVYMVVIWIVGRCVEHAVWSAGLFFRHPPIHIVHYASRQSVFIMIFVGETVIQIIGAASEEHDTGFSYKASMCLAFGICFCVALNYFHTQPQKPSRHVLVKGDWTAYLWFRFHSCLAFFVFAIGVAVKAVFSKFGGMSPYHPYFILLCESLALSYFFSNAVRFLRKGYRLWRRRWVYCFRLVILTLIGLMPLLFKVVGAHTRSPAALLCPVFVLCVLMTLVDLRRRTEGSHSHHEEAIPHSPKFRPNISIVTAPPSLKNEPAPTSPDCRPLVARSDSPKAVEARDASSQPRKPPRTNSVTFRPEPPIEQLPVWATKAREAVATVLIRPLASPSKPLDNASAGVHPVAV